MVKEHRNKKGLLHRTDGPALEFDDGGEEWLFNGIPHRDGGPAISRSDGVRVWCQHGKWHREDGPAFSGNRGNFGWWLNDKNYSLEKWLEKIPSTIEEKVLLKLRYG